MTAADLTDTRLHRGPERPGGQGIDHNQEESANRAIHLLLASDEGKAWTDFVATHRLDRDGNGAYEAWSARGYRNVFDPAAREPADQEKVAPAPVLLEQAAPLPPKDAPPAPPK